MRQLYRTDIRRSFDRAMGAMTLRYVGNRCRFHSSIHGFPNGVFFVVTLADVPMPEEIVRSAALADVDLRVHYAGDELRRLIAETLCAEAMLDASAHLASITDDVAAWGAHDLRQLEREQQIAERRLDEWIGKTDAMLKRRAATRAAPAVPSISLPPPLAPMSAAAPWVGGVHVPPAVLPAPAPEPEPEPEIEDEDERQYVQSETSPAAAGRVLAAGRVAREQELPQRLPAGARRALASLPSGIYLAHGARLERKPDLCAAMADGQETGKRGGEPTIIDWDGEWPVVLRRYGSHGRVVYRVEEALRRAGLEAA